MQSNSIASIVGASDLIRTIDSSLAANDFAQALEACDAVISKFPHHPHKIHVLNNRAVILCHFRQFAEALSTVNLALDINPKDDYALFNRALILNELGFFNLALNDLNYYFSLYEKNLHVDFYYQRAQSYFHLMQLDQAEADYQAHIQQAFATIGEFNGDNYRSKAGFIELNFCNWACANIELLKGNYKKGFDLYEYRHDLEGAFKFPVPKIPLYTGKQDIAGKSLLVYAEQGLGDTIQFARYVPMLESTSAKIYLAVQNEVIDLVRTVSDNFEFLSDARQVVKMDFRVPLPSLPRVFETTLDCIPSAEGYLKVNAPKTTVWQQRLPKTNKLRVGLCWSGGSRPDQPHTISVNQRRNIPLHFFSAFAGLDAEFYNLQLNNSELQNSINLGINVQDYTHFIHNFSDTVAFINNLDLVITVDTSVAHAAAAIGKPTWILNRFDNCWRWLLNRNDSPWYHSVRLFRQSRSNDWGPVIDQVKIALKEQIQLKTKNS
jgi:tetratricopeptide (TPR) repeat protein